LGKALPGFVWVLASRFADFAHCLSAGCRFAQLSPRVDFSLLRRQEPCRCGALRKAEGEAVTLFAEVLKADLEAPPAAAPAQSTLRLSPLGKARLEAMIEKLMKKHQCSREQVLLMALESFIGESTRGDSASPYQVIVQHCPACELKTLGPERRNLSAAESAQIDCDSRVLTPGRR